LPLTLTMRAAVPHATHFPTAVRRVNRTVHRAGLAPLPRSHVFGPRPAAPGRCQASPEQSERLVVVIIQSLSAGNSRLGPLRGRDASHSCSRSASGVSSRCDTMHGSRRPAAAALATTGNAFPVQLSDNARLQSDRRQTSGRCGSGGLAGR
jgi:hypothetical protein